MSVHPTGSALLIWVNILVLLSLKVRLYPQKLFPSCGNKSVTQGTAAQATTGLALKNCATWPQGDWFVNVMVSGC